MGLRFKILLQKIILISAILIPNLVNAICKDAIKISNTYAKGFTVYKGKDFYKVETKRQKIILTTNKNIKCPGHIRVMVPIKKMVALSTTYLPALDMIKEEDTLVGFPDIKLITTPSIIKNIDKKRVKNLNYPVNTELTLALAPEIIIGYSAGAFEEENLSKLTKLGLKIIYNDDFKENSLLARAEWIKFMALFYNKLELATKLFNQIDSSYKETKKKVKKLKKPNVILGDNQNGIWNAPGGESDIASLVKDAGGNYLWKDKKTKKTLFMNIELVWPKLLIGDIWLTQNTWFSMKDLITSDKKNKELKVVKNKMVYNHILKVNKWKNMNYWETGMMRPDLLLKDLVMIFHPSVLQGEKKRWYSKLK